MNYNTLAPNVRNSSVQGVGGFWEAFSESIGFGGPADEGVVTGHITTDVPADNTTIVQTAEQEQGLGTYLGSLFGDVIGGVARTGLETITGNRYQTGADGTIAPVQTTAPASSGGGLMAAGGIGIILLGVAGYFILTSK